MAAMVGTLYGHSGRFYVAHKSVDQMVGYSRDGFQALYRIYNRLCLKNVPHLTCYNLYTHGSIATIFGTNVAEKVGNQNVLYFPTSRN